ncbi:hypothetical protein CHS0354_026405 [Potamilus streckersoni]|uniref:Uncharacterized protein n=1 Tax=Potamilus streckersoni TaxID=2493646 RepID=A0AAE0T3D0_9BIVA|nr:hypothetical protein CHS0354_026405 [Potamilus streckersoni]
MEETGAILKDVSSRKYNNLHYDRLRKARKELTWALSEVRVKKSDVNSIEELLNIIWSFFEDTSNKSTRLRLHIQIEHAMHAYESLKEDLNRHKEKQAAKMHKVPANSPTTKTTVAGMPGLSWERARHEFKKLGETYESSQTHVGKTRRKSKNTGVKQIDQATTRNAEESHIRSNDGEDSVSEEISQGQKGTTAYVKREKHVNFSDNVYVSSIISTYMPLLRSEDHSKYANDLHSGKSRIDMNKQEDHTDVAGRKNAEETSPAIGDTTSLSSKLDSPNSSRVPSEKRITNISGPKLIEKDKESRAETLGASPAKRLSDNGEESDVHSDKTGGHKPKERVFTALSEPMDGCLCGAVRERAIRGGNNFQITEYCNGTQNSLLHLYLSQLQQ